MLNPTPTTLEGPNGLINIIFSEATTEQRLQCNKLAATAFGAPLSETDYLEREEYLRQRPLTRNKGLRFWCLALAEDPARILATCKTIYRDILIRDTNGSRQEKCFCVASVVTDSKFRRYGLATLLLKEVVEWMDGPGDAAASILYTSIGDFYISRGWKMLPAFQSTLSFPLSHIESRNWTGRPSTRFLTDADIPVLCGRDVEDIKAKLENYPIDPDEVLMAVLPTTNLVSWLHDRGDFISLKLNGKSPEFRGSICESAHSWLYWHHDFRKKQLAIQRVHDPEAESSGVETLSGLLLDALEEAEKWSLPKVIVWDASKRLLHAMKFIEDKFTVKVESKERIKSSMPSLRWRGAGQTRNIKVLLNEFYSWS